MNDTEKVIEKILTSDARTKAFRKKLLKLGYVKQAKDARKQIGIVPQEPL